MTPHTRLLALLLTATLASCGAARTATTAAEQAYIAKVDATTPRFKVPRAAIEDLRGKAQVFINRYSPMKVQTTTDFVINTYNPSEGLFGYNVTIEPQGDEMEVEIGCVYKKKEYDFNAINNERAAERNARIMALYLQSGELMPQFITPEP